MAKFKSLPDYALKGTEAYFKYASPTYQSSSYAALAMIQHGEKAMAVQSWKPFEENHEAQAAVTCLEKILYGDRNCKLNPRENLIDFEKDGELQSTTLFDYTKRIVPVHKDYAEAVNGRLVTKQQRLDQNKRRKPSR